MISSSDCKIRNKQYFCMCKLISSYRQLRKLSKHWQIVKNSNKKTSSLSPLPYNHTFRKHEECLQNTTQQRVLFVQNGIFLFIYFLIERQLGVLRFQLMSRYLSNQSPSAINFPYFSLVVLLLSLNINIHFCETVNCEA